MAVNPIPPQAYTKDTLLKAYAWLMNQSQSIKEMATTPDILVSLFMKAQSYGEESLDRPSIQNFKNELRNLAGLMGELDERPVQPSPSHIASGPIANNQAASQVAASAMTAAKPNIGANHGSFTGNPSHLNSGAGAVSAVNASPSVIISSHPNLNHSIPTGNNFEPSMPRGMGSVTSTSSMTAGMITTKVSQTTTTVEANSADPLVDAKTMEMLEEVRVAFNLSSDQEALRMLVSLGYNKAKALF